MPRSHRNCLVFLPTSTLALLALLLGHARCQGQELANLVFTSDLVSNGELNAPNWSFLQGPDGNTTPRATIGSAGRTFQTGPSGNQEALFTIPSQGGTEKFFEGAVWQIPQVVSGETSPNAIVVPTTSVLFVETETYSDLASSWSQWYKVDVSAGIRGNGRSIEGGFDSDRDESIANDHTGETQLTTNTNYSTDPDGDNQQKVQLQGLNLAPSFLIQNSNWQGGATTADLDNTYVNRFTFRHLFDQGTTDIAGTRVETVGALDNNASIDVNGQGAGLPPLRLPEKIDRITVQLLRQGQVPNDRSSFRRYDALATGATEADAQIGIRSVRIGITGRTDFDTSFATTAAEDGAILISNLGGAGANAQGKKLFFDGDASGDGHTTASADGELLLEDLTPISGQAEGSVLGFYNPKTGWIDLRADGVARVSVFSESKRLLTPAMSLVVVDELSPLAAADRPDAGDLTWLATENSLGGGDSDRLAGFLVEPGTPLSDLTLQYQTRGNPSTQGVLQLVPEPELAVLLLLFASLFRSPRR